MQKRYFKVWTIATVLEIEDSTDKETQTFLKENLKEYGIENEAEFSGCYIEEVTEEELTKDKRIIMYKE
jgi:hypothetical protein